MAAAGIRPDDHYAVRVHRVAGKPDVPELDASALALDAAGEEHEGEERIDGSAWLIRREQASCRLQQERAIPELEQLRGGWPGHRQVDALSHPIPRDAALAHRALKHVAQAVDVLALGSGIEALPSMGGSARDQRAKMLEVRLDVARGDLAEVGDAAPGEERGCRVESAARGAEVAGRGLSSTLRRFEQADVVPGVRLDPLQFVQWEAVRIGAAELPQLLKPLVEEARRRVGAAGSEAPSIGDQRLPPSTPRGPCTEVAVGAVIDPGDMGAWLSAPFLPAGASTTAWVWHGYRPFVEMP